MSEEKPFSINEISKFEFNLPDNKNEILIVEKKIDQLKITLICKIVNDEINNNTHTKLYDEIVKLLDYLGRLSTPIFNIEDELEIYYTLNYNHNCYLAKTLFYKHYEKLHQPYTILKNRCFRLIDELDNIYIKTYKKYPPNWEI